MPGYTGSFGVFTCLSIEYIFNDISQFIKNSLMLRCFLKFYALKCVLKINGPTQDPFEGELRESDRVWGVWLSVADPDPDESAFGHKV